MIAGTQGGKMSEAVKAELVKLGVQLENLLEIIARRKNA
jgi:hypothetical protein